MVILSLVAITLCLNITQLLVATMINGVSIGAIVNCGNCWTIHMWGKENGIWMQLIHFAFGFGAFFAPFFAEPFLLQKPAEEGLLEIPDRIVHHNHSTSTTTAVPLMNSIVNETASTFNRDDVSIQYAFYVVAAFNAAILVLCTLTFMISPSNEEHPSRRQDKLEFNHKSKLPEKYVRREHAASIVSTCSRPELGAIPASALEAAASPDQPGLPIRPHMKIIIVGLAALFMHCAFGVELSFGGLLTTFVVKSDMHLSKTTGSYMTSFYWGSFTFFRLFSVIMVNFISSRAMMHVSLCLIALGNMVLLPFGNHYEWALWVGSGLMGIGVSSVYPTLWGFLEDVVTVTGKITSIITIASCMGEFIIPILIGYYIETNPMFYLYIIFGYGFLAYLVFILCCIWANRIIAYRERK